MNYHEKMLAALSTAVGLLAIDAMDGKVNLKFAVLILSILSIFMALIFAAKRFPIVGLISGAAVATHPIFFISHGWYNGSSYTGPLKLIYWFFILFTIFVCYLGLMIIKASLSTESSEEEDEENLAKIEEAIESEQRKRRARRILDAFFPKK